MASLFKNNQQTANGMSPDRAEMITKQIKTTDNLQLTTDIEPSAQLFLRHGADERVGLLDRGIHLSDQRIDIGLNGYQFGLQRGDTWLLLSA